MGIALTPLEIEIFMSKIAPETKKGIDFAGFVNLMLKLRDQREQIAEGKTQFPSSSNLTIERTHVSYMSSC